MTEGIDIDDAGIVMRYDANGADEIDEETTSILTVPIVLS